MPDPGEKARVEVEVAIRDMFSTTLKSMGRELDAMNKKAAELGSSGSGSFNRFRIENDRLNDSAKRSNVSLSSMSTIVAGITQNLAGPVGLVAGFYSAAQSLQSFAASRVQLQNFSTDVGLSVKQVNYWTQGMANMGQNTEEARQNLAKLTSMIQEVNQIKGGSALSRLFVDMGSPEMAKKIQENGGNIQKSIDDILIKFRSMAPEAQGYFARMTGLSESTLLNIKKAAEGAKELYVSDFEHSKEYLKNMNNFQTELSNIWEKIKESGAAAADDSFWKKINAQLKQEVADITAIYDAAKAVYDFFKQIPEMGKPGDKPEADTGGPSRFDKYLPPPNFKERFLDTPNFKDRFPEQKDWLKQGSGTHPSITDFGGRRRDDVEEDSNKSLRDIRDTLLRMETGADVPAGTGGSAAASVSGGSSGGTPRTTFRSGVSSGTGSRGDRNNNPGNLKFGPHAKAFGATHADSGGFAVFPDAASGAAAHETLLKSDSYSGLTLDQFANKYAQGSKSWAKTVGGELGIGGSDIVNNQDPRLAGAIRKAEGTGGGGSGIPSNILAEARAVVAAGGGAEAAKSYIQSKGYNVDSAWCGDFAAAVVKSSGGTPPKNYQVASNWRNFGQPVEGDPQGGDIAVRRGARTGSTGSHVTVVDRFNAESGRFTGIGGNQGRRGMRGDFRQSEYDFFRDNQLVRDTVDKNQTISQRVDANMNASVDFKNMPSWVKSSVDDNGKFKELRVTRSTPQAGKAEAGNASTWNDWAY